MPLTHLNIQGLSATQVAEARAKYGANRLEFKKENPVWEAIKDLAKEPMVLLLLVASLLYFVNGDWGDGIFLATAIVLVAAISLYQDKRSRNALEKLKSFSQPACKVIRDGAVVEIGTEELVMGDCLMVEEGTIIAADGEILHSNDFSVNESILTGESLSVFKDSTAENRQVFRGTTVASGLALVQVTAIGNETRWGEIGLSLQKVEEEKTPLEKQINNFVKKMVFAGGVVFLIVWGINFFESRDFLDSLLKALTLAMSILPEEIPVAFTTFMALGAWRLMKMGIVVKQMKTVETLGSATVICTDKTGTITENRMNLARLFVPAEGRIIAPDQPLREAEKELISFAMWASEPIPFDPMEVALHEAYTQLIGGEDRLHFQMQHEYPLGGRPPMMTHVFANAEGRRIIAAKGAPEALIRVSNLGEARVKEVEAAIETLTKDGYRVLGVGESLFEGEDFPGEQQELKFGFKGIIAFYDPPKANISEVFSQFYQAGIEVKIVTGDNANTTRAIAREIDFQGFEKALNGDELMEMSEAELEARVADTRIFTRMFPEAKLRIINALKANKEIVAMTGDGINDGPALKSAHIGIAMGEKGTEIAKQAASLILLEDDLSKMVDAVAMGRKIYSNLKKAIQYIISIHLPIILVIFLPLALGWIYPNIFSPIHIIFMELIMGPTCSIIYENEPMEKDTMLQKPRPFSSTFFSGRELLTSLIQGLAIAAAALFIYRYGVDQEWAEGQVRAMVFTVLISANIFLTLVNRSFYYSVLTTLRYKNRLLPMMIGITVVLTASLIYIPPLARFFQFETPDLKQLGLSILAGFAGVIWFEGVKGWKRRSARNIPDKK
ncbi:MAG: cation-translocating P-type ATPase [Bacteroidia bacterium]|nr:cation-translocating P-type ATPase [Bacteroidia bacterium]